MSGNSPSYGPLGPNQAGLGASITNQALDPQLALYGQLFNQNQQQGAVNESRSGVSGTPYGAALQDQSGQNFNINWQNAQLGRQTQAENSLSGATNAMSGAAQVSNQNSMMPWQQASMASNIGSQILGK
jgi:hypothetical protein